MRENQGSCEHSMSSLVFVSSRACIAALRRRMLTASMATLSISRGLGEFEYHSDADLADVFL